MATGNNIELRIAATGGAQAAAEIDQVAKAELSLQEQLNARRAGGGTSGLAMDSMTREDMVARGEAAAAQNAARVAEIQRLRAAAEEAAPAVHNLNGNVEASGVNMRSMSRHTNAAARQLTMWSSAVGRGRDATMELGLHLPRLIETIAATGMVSGKVAMLMSGTAAAIPFLVMGGKAIYDAFAGAEVPVANLDEKLKELNKKITEKFTAQHTAEWTAFKESVDNEKTAIAEENEQLKLNRELLDARESGQRRQAQAEAKLAEAKIDADPKKDDATKIRDKAKIRENLELARAADEMTKLQRAAEDAEKQAEQKQGGIDSAEADLDAAQSDANDKNKRQKMLRAKQIAKTDAALNLPAAKKAFEDKQAELSEAEDRSPRLGGAPRTYSPEKVAKLKKEVEEARKIHADAEASIIHMTPAEGDELEVLNNGQKQRDAHLEEMKKARDKAQAAAATARNIADTKRTIATEQGGGIDRDYQTEKQTRQIQSAAAADAAAAADKAQKAHEADQARQKALREREEQLREQIHDEAAGDSSKILGSRAGQSNKTLHAVGQALANGTSDDEVAKLTRMIHDNSKTMNAATLAAMKEMLAGLRKHTQELQQLQRQLKNK